jgi:outer membrane receptor protein involved in Fe transport
MVRTARIAAAAMMLTAGAAPALAQQPTAAFDVPASRLDQAIRALSRQSGASIGFHDPALAALRVHRVRGRMPLSEALDRLLEDVGARARCVAPAAYLIERAPRPARRPIVRHPPPVQAEPAMAEDIVVTATKRNIPLRDYPGEAEIIGGDALTPADARNGTDALEARIASVSSTHLGPGRNKLFIRGIADSSFVGPTQGTVGQYWGNSRITYSAPDPDLQLYDVDRVEVLEGPQGTLYGAGSLGGVVRIVPKAPNLRAASGDFWSGVKATQDGRPSFDGGAVVNAPIVDDRLAFRALGYATYDGGYIDDVGRDLNDINRVRTIGGRAALRFAPSDDWTFDLDTVGQWIDGDDSQYAERDVGDLDRSSVMAQPFRNNYWLAELVARHRWGALELTSSLSYNRQYVFERFEGAPLVDPADPSLGPAEVLDPLAAFTQANHISMITAETRLARTNADGTGWLVAMSGLWNAARVNRRTSALSLSTPLTGIDNHIDEQTLYGEASFKALDRVTVTVGGRLSRSRLSGESQDVSPLIALRIDPEAQASRTETRLLPSLALAYRPTDMLTLYTRFQQGFRPGGIAVRREFIQRFDGDRTSALEAGARYGNRKVDIGISAFWTLWSHIQADLVDGFGFPTTTNIGDGRVLSLGLTSRWRPIRGLQLDAAIYLNDSKVTKQAFALQEVMHDIVDERSANLDRLPNIAGATGRIGFSYRSTLANGLDFTSQGYARYVGKSTLGIGPLLGRLQGDYVDTGLEFRIGTPRTGVSLSLTNLLNSRGDRFALGSPFQLRSGDQYTPLEPRSVRIGFDLSF